MVLVNGRRRLRNRRGAVVILVATTLVILLSVVAFAVDVGMVLKVKTDMQRTADAAALAGAQGLVPGADGTQSEQAARQAVANFARLNMTHVGDANFAVAASDISIGRYNPGTIYDSNAQITSGGTAGLNVVRVTLRRDGQVNDASPLIFGQVLGFQDADLQVTATAILPQPDRLYPGVKILPFAFEAGRYQNMEMGDSFVIYGDGKITDGSGSTIPGNWGTLDIGASNNSTNDLRDQIDNGLRQSDLDALYADGRIPTNKYIQADQTVMMNGDPGLSSGIKHAVEAGHGNQYLIPLFEEVGGSGNSGGGNSGGNGNGNGNGNGKNKGGNGNTSGGGGNNVEYRVTSWATVTLDDSNWNGANNTWVQVTKSAMYDGHLSVSDLTKSDAAIDGAYGAPMLVR